VLGDKIVDTRSEWRVSTILRAYFCPAVLRLETGVEENVLADSRRSFLLPSPRPSPTTRETTLHESEQRTTLLTVPSPSKPVSRSGTETLDSLASCNEPPTKPSRRPRRRSPTPTPRSPPPATRSRSESRSPIRPSSSTSEPRRKEFSKENLRTRSSPRASSSLAGSPNPRGRSRRSAPSPRSRRSS